MRAIVASWRRLTTPGGSRKAGPGQAVLVACSGGADSSALVLALAAAGAKVVVGHVVHDLRPRTLALADRDAVRELADSLGLPYVEASVRVKGAGNAEGAARRARYAALVRLARRAEVEFVATAHHADDQLETVLMAMMRGSGPRGLAGVAETRLLAPGVRLIRPMLVAGVGRAESVRICEIAGHAWQEDSTNTDESRLRAAVRRRIIPLMKEVRPAVAARACAMARLMGDVDVMLRARAAALLALRETEGMGGDAEAMWDRERLRRERAAVLGQLIRLSAAEIAGENARPDRLGQAAVGPVVRAIRDSSTEPRRFAIGGIEVRVTAREVTIKARRSR